MWFFKLWMHAYWSIRCILQQPVCMLMVTHFAEASLAQVLFSAFAYNSLHVCHIHKNECRHNCAYWNVSQGTDDSLNAPAGLYTAMAVKVLSAFDVYVFPSLGCTTNLCSTSLVASIDCFKVVWMFLIQPEALLCGLPVFSFRVIHANLLEASLSLWGQCLAHWQVITLCFRYFSYLVA